MTRRPRSFRCPFPSAWARVVAGTVAGALAGLLAVTAALAAPKVVIISLDGATPRFVDQYLASGALGANTGLGLLQSKGLTARQNVTISPSLTAPGHIAIATGSRAANNDIVANTFHLVASPFIFTISGRLFVDYQTRVGLRAISRFPDADLVMIYIEQPDGSGHQFLLTDPRQPTDFTNPASIGAGQDQAKVARYASYVQGAYQVASDAVQRVIEAVGTDAAGVPKSNIIVVSDHGFETFHTAVSMNNFLAARGFDSAKVRAITSGPAVNIYITSRAGSRTGPSPGRSTSGSAGPSSTP